MADDTVATPETPLQGNVVRLPFTLRQAKDSTYAEIFDANDDSLGMCFCYDVPSLPKFRASADLIVCAANSHEPLLAMVNAAMAVMQRQIVPDGISEKQAIDELWGIFDGPLYRAAMQHVDGKER